MAASIASLLAVANETPVKIERTRLKAQIVDFLRSQIIFGHLPPGTPLVERELAETLQISRIPVRDALQELEKEGLVVSTATNRRSVIRLTERDIRELYEVRLRLEDLAVEQAARNTSPTYQEQLRAALATMEHSFRERNPAGFPRADVNLHRTIWAQADNRHLDKLLQTMAGQLFMFASIHTQLYTWDEVVDLHRDLVQQIILGNVPGARASIERHMQNSLHRALRALDTPPADYAAVPER
jgi:DNA-binding GntR family transcriptional regulator